MLRRTDSASLAHNPGFWTGKGPVVFSLGARVFLLGKLSRAGFADRHAAQMKYPVPITTTGGRRYWQFQNKFYSENDGLSSDEIHALLVTREQRKRQQIDRAQATFAMGYEPRNAAVRRAIPDDLKQYIWTRDEGRCRSCGSTNELQFDHIIPVSKGGSSNAENLQVLCGPCNRSKSSGLTTRR